jgi:hypothetical protein
MCWEHITTGVYFMLQAEMISWVMTALSIAGKGFITKIPLQWRFVGFILLALTGVYWTYDLIEIHQTQMALLQMMYTLLNAWGAYNAFVGMRCKDESI